MSGRSPVAAEVERDTHEHPTRTEINMGALTLVAPRTEHDALTGRKLYEFVKRKKPDAEFGLTSERVTLRFSFRGEDDLTLGLDTMTAWNVRQMQRGSFAKLYDAGVRYEREILCNHNGVVGICEEWWTSSVLYARKSGDCEDLSCTLAAQLIVQGETTARARARRSSIGWHIQVRRADGSIEDPSAKLGMLDQ